MSCAAYSCIFNAAMGKYFKDVAPVACDLCGADRPANLAERDKYGVSVKTVICTRCGLLYLSPRPTPEAYEEFYQAEYRDLVSSGEGQELEVRYQGQRAHGRTILEFCRGLLPEARRRVLDIGCDAGGVLQEVSEALGLEPYGVEPNREAVAFAKRKMPGARVFEGYFEETPFEEGSFGLIILTQTLNHLLSPTEALRKVRRLLDPGGLAFVEVFNVMATASWTNMSDHAKVDHPYMFGVKTFRALLAKVGLEVLRFEEDTFEDYLRKEGLKTPGAICHLRAAVRLGQPLPEVPEGYGEVRSLLKRRARRMALPRLLRRMLGERGASVLLKLAGGRGRTLLHRFASGSGQNPAGEDEMGGME